MQTKLHLCLTEPRTGLLVLKSGSFTETAFMSNESLEGLQFEEAEELATLACVMAHSSRTIQGAGARCAGSKQASNARLRQQRSCREGRVTSHLWEGRNGELAELLFNQRFSFYVVVCRPWADREQWGQEWDLKVRNRMKCKKLSQSKVLQVQ